MCIFSEFLTPSYFNLFCSQALKQCNNQGHNVQYSAVGCTVHYSVLYYYYYNILQCTIPVTTVGCTVYCSVLYSVLQYTVKCSILYCTVNYSVLHSVLLCTVQCTAVYFTVQCIVLYTSVYCTVHFSVLYSFMNFTVYNRLLNNKTLWPPRRTKCLQASGYYCMQARVGKDSFFWLTLTFFRDRFVRKMCKLQLFEIDTKLRKSQIWTFIWLNLVKKCKNLVKFGKFCKLL